MGFVDRDEEERVDGSENGYGSGWDLEVWAEIAVHGLGLADEEGGDLGEGDG